MLTKNMINLHKFIHERKYTNSDEDYSNPGAQDYEHRGTNMVCHRPNPRMSLIPYLCNPNMIYCIRPNTQYYYNAVIMPDDYLKTQEYL